MKKQIAIGLAAAMMITVAGATAVMAAPGDVNVSYHHLGNNIPGPDEPDAPIVSVTIPTSIVFTGANQSRAINIGLVPLEGSLADLTNTYKVTVASANGYALSDGTDEVDYEVEYPGFTNLETTGITLNKDNATRNGTARLSGDVQPLTENNDYVDVLTYSVAIQ